ncbi:MAG: succinate dehydrogenase, hydrophobic membrane anchor protein [Alphaproteobacteria bacterium]
MNDKQSPRPARQETMRPELAKARGLGSAKSGTHHWIMQRFSAVALVFLFIYVAYFALSMVGADYQAATSLIAHPVHAIMLSLFLIAGFYHGQLGLQVVIEDYVHHKLLNIALIWAVKLLAFALGAAGIFAILSIAL